MVLRLILLIAICASEPTEKQLLNNNNINDASSDRNPKILGPGFNEIDSALKPAKQMENFFYTENPVEEFTLGNNDTLSPHGKEVVNKICGYLSNLRYRPVVVLLQDKPSVLNDAEVYMSQILKHEGVHSEFWLMKFNASGVSAILAKTSNVDINYFKKLITENNETSYHLEPNQAGGALFFSIIKAVRILPLGSGILIFTDSKIEDEDLAHLSIKETLSKQIRLITVWQGLYPSLNNEEKLIREATMLSHGQFFIGNTERDLTNFDNQFYSQDKIKANSIVAHLTNVYGDKLLNIPIDDGVTSIHISLTLGVNMAHFTSPNGYLIDLFNLTAVGLFARGSYIAKVGEMYEIELNTAHNIPTPVVGIWRLKTGAFAQRYNITVSLQNNLVLNTKVIHANKNQGYGKSENILRLDLQGDFDEIENITLVNKYGQPINTKLNFDLNETNQKQDVEMNIETINEKDVDINLKEIPHEPLYIQVDGRDKRGNKFVRLSYFDRDNMNHKLQSIQIEVGLGSELLTTPNQGANIYFEVTNNKNQMLFVQFICQDEKRLLRWMQPQRAWLSPRQTVVVTVSTFTRPSAGVGYRDHITFSAISGTERYQKNSIMTVNNNREYDIERPHMWHKYTSDCLNVLLGHCEDASWTIEVTAQDRETGLLQLTASPPGLYFPYGYTTGTKEEVTGVYSGSCCQPIIQLIAVDMVNNRRSYIADAYKAPLGPGAIAAICMGVILLVILIIVLICIFKCGKCRRKESVSVDLPTSTSYRGPVNSASTRRY